MGWVAGAPEGGTGSGQCSGERGEGWRGGVLGREGCPILGWSLGRGGGAQMGEEVGWRGRCRRGGGGGRGGGRGAGGAGSVGGGGGRGGGEGSWGGRGVPFWGGL